MPQDLSLYTRDRGLSTPETEDSLHLPCAINLVRQAPPRPRASPTTSCAHPTLPRLRVRIGTCTHACMSHSRLAELLTATGAGGIRGASAALGLGGKQLLGHGNLFLFFLVRAQVEPRNFMHHFTS
jgi:hypothetical protein